MYQSTAIQNAGSAGTGLERRCEISDPELESKQFLAISRKQFRKTKRLRKTFVMNQLAIYASPDDIVKNLSEIHGIKIRVSTVYYMAKKHKFDIDQLRARFLASTIDVPIAQERVRLERDEAMYQLAQTIARTDIRISKSVEVLREAREEIKGPGSNGMPASGVNAQFNQFNFNNISDSELIGLEKKLRRDLADVLKKEA